MISGSDQNNGPVSFAAVLRTELRVIDEMAQGSPEKKKDEDAEPDVYQQALERDLVGLAFSGGGIRSATFNLGVLQALADRKLLRFIHYLSTVSGGGYIGAWLTALIHRENNKGSQPGEPSGICRVEDRLRPVLSKQPHGRQPGAPGGGAREDREPGEEDSAIKFLRQYSSYLTPRVGLFTADTWSMIAIYVRNLLLNLILLVSGLAALLLVPRLIIAVTHWSTSWEKLPVFWLALVATAFFGLLAAVQFGVGFASLMTHGRSGKGGEADNEHDPSPPVEEERKGVDDLQQSTIVSHLVAPLIMAAFLISRWLPAAVVAEGPWHHWKMHQWAMWGSFTYGGACILAFFSALYSKRGIDRGKWVEIIFTGALAGAVAGPLLQACGGLLEGLDERSAWVLGPPLVVLWSLALGLLHTGIMGADLSDLEREWLSRLGALQLIFGAGWGMWFGVIIYGPVAFWASGVWIGGAVASGWIATTVGGLVAARSAPGSGGPGIVRSLVLAVAPYVFVAGLLAVLAVGLDLGLSWMVDEDPWSDFWKERNKVFLKIEEYQESKADDKLEKPDLWGLLYLEHGALFANTSENPLLILGLILFLLAVGLVLGWRIDVNEFSMHGFYRNRLARCYLGATVEPEERHLGKEPFTGLYEGDDLELGELCPAGKGPAPIHLINTSLNLVAGEELAWQERKAAPFVLSPVYCGFEPREAFDNDDKILKKGYRRTSAYGGQTAANGGQTAANGGQTAADGEQTAADGKKKAAYGSRPVALTLGSAIASSGAAVSPNMGFHSTPALAFLLTVFNVRVGRWLGNPRHPRTWTRSGPVIALMQLFMELFGQSNARTRYVYLSDGEHFENLGIYELVRRRCRFILATDVGADPDGSFDSLGNAIRKCRADLGIEIEIDVDQLRAGEDGFSKWHCAVGDIRYPTGDGGTESGTLLYIKSSLTGNEPQDVLSYAWANPPFPHQTTADQFFDESQFESYRRLGLHVAEEVLQDAVEVAVGSSASATEGIPRLEKLVTTLRQRWYRPSRPIEDSFTHHAATLDRLFERQRTTPELAFLDAQVYPEWHRLLDGAKLPKGARVSQSVDTLWLPKSAKERRQGFYFCNSLIQLMENAYLDLDLDLEYDHPDNRGWMNLFKHWSWSGMFRATWTVCAATYGRRFQAFCQRRLGLELGSVKVHWLDETLGKISEASFQKDLKSKRPDYLNFLEREQIEVFLAYGKVPVHKVAQFELQVQGNVAQPGKEELLRFAFGYALFDENEHIALFRIQDHLRSMGLGRLALRSMGWEHPALRKVGERGRLSVDLELGEKNKMAAACERFEKEFRGVEKGFEAMLRSVHRELQQEASRDQRIKS